MDSKIIHVVIFIIVVTCCGGIFYFLPELRKDSITVFTVMSGFLTLYGVVFAAIQVVRARKSADLAKIESEKVFHKMDDLYGLRDITQCLSAIEMAMDSIIKNEHISASTLLTITKVYSAIFSTEIDDEKSEYRKNNSMLHSFSHAAESSNSTNKVRLRKALLSMSSHLSGEAGKKTSIKTLER